MVTARSTINSHRIPVRSTVASKQDMNVERLRECTSGKIRLDRSAAQLKLIAHLAL